MGRAGSTSRSYRLNPPVGCEHPLVAARRPADRRADPAASAVPRRTCGGAMGGRRSRRLLPYLLLLFSLALDGTAADRPARLSARLHRAASSPARPTACSCPSGSIITAGSSRCWRSAWRRLPIPSGSAAALMLGISTALSLAIGLEMIIYLAIVGRGDRAVLGRRSPKSATGCALMHCRWAAGTALGFLVFASYDNRAPVCDACRRSGCRMHCSAAR